MGLSLSYIISPEIKKKINISLLGVSEDDISVTAEQQGLEVNWIIDRKNIKVEEKFKAYMNSRGGREGRNYWVFLIIWVLIIQYVISHTGHKFNATAPVPLQITNPKVIW